MPARSGTGGQGFDLSEPARDLDARFRARQPFAGQPTDRMARRLPATGLTMTMGAIDTQVL